MFEQVKSVYILGIKGVAMANLAVILKKMGKNVTGSDVKEAFITDSLLETNGISYSIGFDTENLPDGIDLLIYSAAHGGINNPIAFEARKQGIPVVSQAELLAGLMNRFKTKIAVSGCHGKTTTSSLLSYALIQLGTKPSYLVGAPSFNEYAGGDYADNTYFIVEADEYGVNPPHDLRPKFHFFDPDYSICTNIDFDHPDVYKNLESTRKAFLTFFDGKKLVVCADDLNLMSVVQSLPRDQYQTYGFSEEADFRVLNKKTQETGTLFTVSHKSRPVGDFAVSLFGDKNVSNAAAVIVMLITLGFSPEKIRPAIQNFTGAKRRFEKVYENENGSLYDDYGHHPHEIEATILAARKHFPNRRIIVVFQPHTYSRTQMLLNDFAQTLSLADYSYVLPIFPSAREDSSKFSVRSEDIVKQAHTNNLSFAGSDIQLINRLNTQVQKGDVIFTMGAGDVYKLKDKIITVIESKT